MENQKKENHGESKPATRHTIAQNKGVLASLPFEDRRMFDQASRGFIATLEPLTLKNELSQRITYDLSGMSFLREDAPETVNPSLWRQAQLNTLHNGLYEVVDGIYQVRSFDLGHMTLVRSDNGWIVIDPLTSSESARAAVELAGKHLGKRPVKAVIFTHSHADHYAGVLGVVSRDDVLEGRVRIIAPENFTEAALSENVLAGNVMRRRATYMYGTLLSHSPRGFVTNGLGPQISMGATGFIEPTDIVRKTGETRNVDGIEIAFQMTPETEAVAEFIFYFPKFRALCTSEITSHHLHNIYTLRGAQLRNALSWSNQINEAIDRFGRICEVQFASHHWPTWGSENVVGYLEKQRDLYKFIHDQTLRLANHGFTMEEIAEQIKLPQSLSQEFSCRDYYGTIRHNSKAVYVWYLGFFNGNPAGLNPLPQVEAANRYVQYMGGAEAVLKKALESYGQGDYRWVAEVVNHVVMAAPDNESARGLLADTLEQLAYQAESGPWRNFYLTGSLELRQGLRKKAPDKPNENIIQGMPLDSFCQMMAIRLNAVKLGEAVYAFNIFFTDLKSALLMSVQNGVLNFFPEKKTTFPTGGLRLKCNDFKRMMAGITDPTELIENGALAFTGDFERFRELLGCFDKFNMRFPIITPVQHY